MRTPEQCERMVKACLTAAHNKRLPGEKRMEARIAAKRWRVLAKRGREREAFQQRAKQDSSRA